MFTAPLTDRRAAEIAQVLLAGFDRHYRLFLATSAAAQGRFEAEDWAGQQAAQRERIEFYDLRVDEAAARLQGEFGVGDQDLALWAQVKLHFMGLLTHHLQPELAETFFNSVTTQVLDHRRFHKDVLFMRPAVSTEYIENDEPEARPTYRAYYPTPEGLRHTLDELLAHYQLRCDWEDLPRDLERLQRVVAEQLGAGPWRANCQIQALSALFFRNKGAYVVGKLVNGHVETPFALAIVYGRHHRIRLDAALFGEDELQRLFSFARAYFQVAMAVPAAVVQFLRALMPRKPRSELYSALGLHKQGKTLFFRDFQHHLRHSSDAFRIAPGIKGLVMLVFDLPSYPFVFKLIKDRFPPQKPTTREGVKAKYQLVKQHDRVGRMADTLEFSNVVLPRGRFSPELLAELQREAPSQVVLTERDGQPLVLLRHVYIERRLVPLNLYLQEATPVQLEAAVIEYGNAIKDLVAANIFPGDMLWKNFGVARHGKVVFYDYDEIEYLTDCTFRHVPAPRNEEEEMSGEVWYAVRPGDVFPETFEPFLLGHPGVREAFMAHHADLLDPAFWQAHQARIRAGHVHDIFPYDPARRFGPPRADEALPPPPPPEPSLRTP
ncbi:bifunctional isocitrate dehydrogenase kinase/phosphatase [Ideonella livida]|uniref:Isocitrate dehydrogenase kinase/phosphatase n=1 Tax=Ideonella livida TaxID=2707176 RepID=A0A7C9TLK2_9BURK|nr:bifunctional isocitrate dehydrogenase kinase/phosphatase [Ideonella livida]NDY92682.1 bifunctional isocitrate dehydrogenase kinase/phosphatase [Ideonella livida]